jgi:type II secretory pathway pseudopilin PulG
MFNLPGITKIVDCRKLKKSGEGFTTIELVMASVIMAVCLSAVLALLWYERVMALNAEMNQRAMYLAQSFMEKARADLKTNFYTNVNQTSENENFTVAVNQKYLTNFIKEINVNVSWVSALSPNSSYEIKAQVYDLNNMAEADTCNTFLSGDWQNPQLLPNGIDLGSGIKATGIDVKNNIAYISADSSTISKADFFIVDVSDTSHPQILSSISTGPGLGAVKVFENYAYAANLSTLNQLQIINISDSLHPFLAYSFNTGSGSKGVSLNYSRHKIYLGTEISVFREFYIIDVLNPLSPVTLGSFETDTKINSIETFNNLAYLATPNQEQVRVLNVSDPSRINQLSSFSPSGSATQHGKSLYLKGDRLFFGKSGLNSPQNINPKLFNLDVTNSNTNPVPLDTQNLGSTPNAILERSGYLFFATNDSSNEFQVWQVFDNGTMSSFSSLDLPAEAVGLDCEGEVLFLAQSSQDGLKIISPGY